ncbi:peptide chain release factor 1-like, mitochondrial isoform X1 [Oncorhynchus keta]|uniref:peptide chain release factor 1-like, mitochondrial isoform X1 n=2 Tax=Oncorhynchus keta TaxID=8018 RepID=UPI0015FB0EA8|nr:peptide chain release factor 1-like, mitochondrial isoform X1 [Oncorhynchus keta]
MAFTQAVKMHVGNVCVRSWMSFYQRGSTVMSQRQRDYGAVLCGRCQNSSQKLCPNSRAMHATRPLMITKLLSVDEIFARRSLQDYIKKMETEYRDSLTVVNMTEGQQDGEEELRVKRTRVSVLAPLIQYTRELQTKQQEFAETETLLKDDDPDMRDLAVLEREACQKAIKDVRQKILSLLIPEEESDMSDLVLEVTAGVGGQEAMLFTAEVFDMYQSFAAHQGWGFDILEYMKSEIGGLRHASASVSGPKSYKRMKFEAGVHRVQRVPKTEKQGRMHTSTMTVAVLPQPTEITFTINAKDLRIETKRASGAGGQHVNTTDSAVRIVHLPTGVVSECQQERSQLKNKEKAMKVLRAKLYSMRLEEETSKRYTARKVQIGTKGRSEKIRTYNFPQDRITDHRILKTVHDVREFLVGEELLEEMNLALEEFSNQEILMDILGENNSDQ